MIPFGTRVIERNTDPDVVGIILRQAADAEDEYVVQWPSGRQTLERRSDLTVIEEPQIAELRSLRFALVRLIRAFDEDNTGSLGTIDENVQPFADAVLAWHNRALERSRSLRDVSAADVPPGAWIWGSYRADADFKVITWHAPCPLEAGWITAPGRRYIIGPDPGIFLQKEKK